MPWFTLTIISAIGFALSGLIERILMKDEESDPIAYGFVFQIITGAIIFIYALFVGINIPNLVPLIPNLIITAVAYALVNYTLFKAYQTTEASIVAILFSTRSIWSIIAALLFLNEQFNTYKAIGAILIIFGVIAISLKKEQIKFTSGYGYTLIAAFCLGIAFTNDAYILQSFDNVPSYLFISFILPAFTILLFNPKSIKNIKLFTNITRIKNMSLNSIFYAISTIAIFMAYKSGGDVSQIAPISQSTIIITVILAYIFLKERNRVVQKILGTILVFAGILFLK